MPNSAPRSEERLLVCIDERRDTIELVWHAYRLARDLKAPWTALHVETVRYRRLSEAERDGITNALRLAVALGGEALTIPGTRVVDAVVAHARTKAITRIVIGRSDRPRWLELFAGSVEGALVRGAAPWSVIVANTHDQGATRPLVPLHWWRMVASPLAYLLASAVIGLAVVVGLILQDYMRTGSAALIFIAGVLIVAARWGLGPSLLAGALSVPALNYFFLPPIHSLAVRDPENIFSVLIFAAIAVFVSELTARTRLQAAIARDRAAATAALYSLSRKLAAIGDLDELLAATAKHMALLLKARIALLLPEEGALKISATFPPDLSLAPGSQIAAQRCWDGGHRTANEADETGNAGYFYLPMRTERGRLGVAAIDRVGKPERQLSADERRLFDAMVDQVTVAVERIHLARAVDEARVAAETERLRSALLSSLSHDLRTPLASILGSATSLRSFGSHYRQESRDELIATIQEEAERLNRFVGNLLDITRLEAGVLAPKTEPIDLGEVVGATIRRAKGILAEHKVQLSVAPDLPLIDLDGSLIEQALFNLLDNAAKYAPPDSTVGIDVRRQGPAIVISVADGGPGIPECDLERIFDKFYRAGNRDRQRAGTGLGLAICRGFIETMGGRVQVANRTDRPGAVFTISIPVAEAARPVSVAADHDE